MAGVFVATPKGTGVSVGVAVTAAVKTLLQVATPSTTSIVVKEWWISFDGTSILTPILVELIDCDVAATVTSLTPDKFNQPSGEVSLCVGGTSATGYNGTAEGSVGATTRVLSVQRVSNTAGIYIQYPLGTEPRIPVSRFLRIRTTSVASDTPTAVVGIVFEE